MYAYTLTAPTWIEASKLNNVGEKETQKGERVRAKFNIK
jgi:hypothetical protein